MRLLFADTTYYLALLNGRDSLHQAALSALLSTRGVSQVTTPLVLAEVLDALSRSGTSLRVASSLHCRRIITSGEGQVIALTRELLLSAIQLYSARLDKDWGLTDCVSFEAMKQLGITEALTYDNHFIQAGFRALLREA